MWLMFMELFKFMSNGPSQTTSKLIKTIVIGKVSVGKSSLILKYADRNNALPHTTVGIDILLKRVCHKGQSYAFQLWDTAGHERYRTVVYNYFFHAQAAVVVFDLGDEESLAEAHTWLQQITLYCGEGVPKLLLGNKSDLFEANALAKILESYKQKIEQLKLDFSCDFYPVSAKTGYNLQASFKVLLDRSIQHSIGNEQIKTIKLHSPIQIEQLTGNKKSRCC